ncbi:MAG: hypothetical protein WC376_05350 [Candidatus Nanoarchaeia archaeon]|jgi:hypothetical protein
MNAKKIQGTDFFVNVKDENSYELSLIIQNQLIHTFGFNLENYTKMINHLKQTKFSQNTDYSLDSDKLSSFYITRWETNGIPTYCSRAWVNNDWSIYSLMQEQDLKNLPKNLESLIIPKKPLINLPLNHTTIFKETAPESETNSQENQTYNADKLKKEMIEFLQAEKEKMKGK